MSEATLTKARIRWAVKQDRGEILDILNDAGLSITEDALIKLLNDRNTIAQVAEIGDHYRDFEPVIAGVAIYRLEFRTLHILKLAVDPLFARNGIGRQLVEHLKGKISPTRPKLTLNCRETNLKAQLFYRSCGLKAVGIRPEHYPDTGEDAFAFEYRLRLEE